MAKMWPDWVIHFQINYSRALFY